MGQGLGSTSLWRVKLSERRIGTPILADLNDDGIAEILVPSEEGILLCLAPKLPGDTVRRRGIQE